MGFEQGNKVCAKFHVVIWCLHFRSKRKHSNAQQHQLSAYYNQNRKLGGGAPPGGANGSSDDPAGLESSMESIESTAVMALRPLSVLTPGANGAAATGAATAEPEKQNQLTAAAAASSSSSSPKLSSKLQKISSADSLFSMIKNLTASNASKLNTSTPSSPQFSELEWNLASSGFPTPLTTPDTPNATTTVSLTFTCFGGLFYFL